MKVVGLQQRRRWVRWRRRSSTGSRLRGSIELYRCDVDSNFPNHHPDPSKPESAGRDPRRAKPTQRSGSPSTATAAGSGRVAVTKDGEIIYPDRESSCCCLPKTSSRGAWRADHLRRPNVPATSPVDSRARQRTLMWNTGHAWSRPNSRKRARRWRDERPRVLQGALVRFRRRPLHGLPGCRILSRSADASAVLKAPPDAISNARGSTSR